MLETGTREAVDHHKIILKVLELLNSVSWTNLSLMKVAQETGLSPLTLYKHFMTKGDLLTGIVRYMDERTLEIYKESDPEVNPRDALFDIVMCRLEGLEPHKNAIRSLSYDLWQTPFNALEACPSALNSFKWMLNLAYISTTGILGMIKLKAFAIVYGIIIKTWLEDKENDLSKTMVVVDKLLKKIEPVLGGF